MIVGVEQRPLGPFWGSTMPSCPSPGTATPAQHRPCILVEASTASRAQRPPLASSWPTFIGMGQVDHPQLRHRPNYRRDQLIREDGSGEPHSSRPWGRWPGKRRRNVSQPYETTGQVDAFWEEFHPSLNRDMSYSIHMRTRGKQSAHCLHSSGAKRK